MKKILIIRFSSIGDIIQCMSVVDNLKNNYPESILHWVTRKDMASLLQIDSRIDRIWEFNRNNGLIGLIKLALKLRQEKYTHIYDAHSNIRSNLLKIVLCPFGLCNYLSKQQIITRHKDRLKRLLLFKFKINLFPKPFRSFESFKAPLRKFKDYQNKSLLIKDQSHYHFPVKIQSKMDELLSPFNNNKWICLVPSAAWELKRWPVEYWQKLVIGKPDINFVVIGGPNDFFCEDIKMSAPERVINLAGKTTLLESFYVIFKASYIISGDTGFLHAADLFKKPGQALIGPTAFGFPSGKDMKVMEIDLYCRPCTKDGNVKCINKIHKKCMLDILPEYVIKESEQFFR